MKIISGGQTGVDRAALDFALKHNINCGGFCPKGRLAEDGKIDIKYPLIETSSSDYDQRTLMNIINSDGSLVIINRNWDKGTKLTKELAEQYNRPILIVDLSVKEAMNHIGWMSDNKIVTINIAGPRESLSPGIYNKTRAFLDKSFPQNSTNKPILP